MKKNKSESKSLKNNNFPSDFKQEASTTLSVFLDAAERQATSLEEVMKYIALAQKLFRGRISADQYKRMDMMEERYKTTLPPITPTGSTETPPQQLISREGHPPSRDGQSSELPTREQMCKALAYTVKEGMWWCKRSWAVVCRVYQIKGYMGTINDFLIEVSQWNVNTGYACNYDAVQKMMATGRIIGNPDNWEKQHAPKQAVILGKALLAFFAMNLGTII